MLTDARAASHIAAVMVGVVAGLQCVQLLPAIEMLGLIDAVDSGPTAVSEAVVDAVVAKSVVLANLANVALVLSGIAWAWWLSTFLRRLLASDGSAPAQPNRAWMSLVPYYGHLIRMPSIVRDAELQAGGASAERSWIVPAWWAAWAAVTIIGLAIYAVNVGASPDLAVARLLLLAVFPVAALWLAAAILAVLVIRELEDRLAARAVGAPALTEPLTV